MQSGQPDPSQDISGVIQRIHQLGGAAESIFSRLGVDLSRRNRDAEAEALAAVERILAENGAVRQQLRDTTLEIEQLREVFARISEGVILQDTEGRMVLINDAAYQLLGSQKNFWQSELGILFSQYRNAPYGGSELAALSEPHQVLINERLLGAQLMALNSPSGERLGTLLIVQDISESSLSERLKNSFITHISHELNTPLNVMRIASEMLINTPEDQPPNRRMLSLLSKNIDILNRMVTELLEVSEITSGSFRVRHETIRLDTIAWDVLRALRPQAEEMAIKPAFMVRDENALTLSGDPTRLTLAIGHLLRNALMYNEQGGRVVITIRPDQMPDPQQLILQVIDGGVGISDEELPHIFELFYRGKPRTRAGKLLDPRGLGQGLYIARAVAQAHGGTLEAQSQAGIGSTLTLTLPVQSSSEAEV